ncbi:MAG: UbiA family prenyltransferase [Thermoplasmata archaeon]
MKIAKKLGNYIYSNSISFIPMIFTIPYGILISATLYVSDFRDRDFDSKINFRTLPVILGKYSQAFFHVLFATFYFSIGILIILKIYPGFSLISLITLPLNHILLKNLGKFSLKNMEFIFGNFIFLSLTLLSILLILA